MHFFCELGVSLAAAVITICLLLPTALAAPTSFTPPAPPGQPSADVANTQYTTRLFGRTPAEVAVSVTRHAFTAAMHLSDPKTKNGASDRPWSVILVTPDDPVAISAAELIQFPKNAPILFVDKSGIPAVTLEELKRLSPVGFERAAGVQAFVIGAAASEPVLNQLQHLGLKTRSITASDNYAIANQLDTLYGQLHSPDTGVPTMMNSVKKGNGIMDVFIGSTDAPLFMLPIAEWASHLPSGILWISGKADKLPQPTIDALKRRQGKAMIYVIWAVKSRFPKL